MSKIHKNLTKRLFNTKHNIELNSIHLNDIDDIYNDINKEAIKKIGMFRFINLSIGLCFLVLFFFIRGTEFSGWMFFGLMFLFCLYNLIHCFYNYKQHREIKRRNINGEQ